MEDDHDAGSNGGDEQNEGLGSQHGAAGPSRKMRKCSRTNDEDDMIGSGVSQSSSTSDFRRVTRRSARLM